MSTTHWMPNLSARMTEIIEEFRADRDQTDERVALENLARALAATEVRATEARTDGAQEATAWHGDCQCGDPCRCPCHSDPA